MIQKHIMIKLVIIAALTFIISESHAQYNVLKADPLGPLRGNYGVAFERSFSPKWSARILAEFCKENFIGQRY